MNNASPIIIPGQDLLVPRSRTLQEVNQVGPFKTGELLPWKGLFFAVVKIVADETGFFTLVLAPKDVTKGTIKRANGKKGKKNAKATNKRRGLSVLPSGSTGRPDPGGRPAVVRRDSL